MQRLLPSELLFSILACSFLCSCSNAPRQACPPGELVAFFSNPSASQFDALASCLPDTAAYNKEFRSCRDTAPLGTVRTVLADSAGLPFHLGYVTPKTLTTGAAYPLVIYLHGGIGTERIDKGDSAFLMLEPLADSLDLFLASPSANHDAPWWTPSGLSRILQTLRYMTLRYPVDLDRIFLAGVSDGATGCYAAANTIPGPFAGFIAVSGFGGMLPALGMPLLPANLMQRPIYNVNAGGDHLYPVGQVKQFITALQEQGVAVTDKWYMDEKHGFDYRDKEMGALAGLLRTWKQPASGAIAWIFVPGFPNLPANLLDWTLAPDDNAFVQAYWRGDTLMVRSKGVQSFTMAMRSATIKGDKIACRFLDGRKQFKRFPRIKNAWPEQLRLLESGCFPEFFPSSFYRISIP